MGFEDRLVPWVQPRGVLDLCLERTASCLSGGGVALLPTDTVYGLHCLWDVRAARDRVHRLKGGEHAPNFVCLVSDRAMAFRYAEELDVEGAKFLGTAWPGPTTAILRARHAPAGTESTEGTLAFRCPDDPWIVTLVRHLGKPIVSTSANRHRQPTVTTVEEAWAVFGEELDLYVDRGSIAGSPSALVDLTKGAPRILRSRG